MKNIENMGVYRRAKLEGGSEMLDLDDLVARVSAKIKANGGITPSRVLRGYSWHIDEATVDPNCDLTDKQTEDAIEWLISEIHRLLPDYADWDRDTSEIILPIDKVQEFTETVDWDALCEQAWENFVENCNSIIGEEA